MSGEPACPCEAEACRLWALGEIGQAALWNRLATAMGPARARLWLAEFEARLGAAQSGRPPRRSTRISHRFLV
ncbi:MAG: hypothetical protein RQ752_14570 [Thermohalobaculum sp.]|nr:hypothetical protein [Thermohalobaculum sp.]